MIEVAHLTRRFGALVAVDDASFHLERGEVVGFLGPNGAGKTTTMRILTGFLPATSAQRLEIAGHDVLRESLEVRRKIGYLPESVPLYRELRVREMMSFQGRLHGLSSGELRRRIPEVLERVGVLDRERQLVGTLSRGLRQRVGLAVALLAKPEVLILDEPTSGLDPIQRLEVRALIRELAEEHTVLLSSHILAEIEDVCPRVIILRGGKIVADGRQEELVTNLSGKGSVRMEAFVGPDVAEALRLIESLPGVEAARDAGKQGIHQAFEVDSNDDVREDLGALAAQKGWALRELSRSQPTLEQIFARVVLGGENVEEREHAAPKAPEPAAAPAPTLESSLPTLETAPAAEAPGKVIYSLNPFDRGASRDLSKPVQVTPPPADVEPPPQQGPDA